MLLKRKTFFLFPLFFITKLNTKKSAVIIFLHNGFIKYMWCPERDLNSHNRFQSRDFKSLASTNSAIRASAQKRKYIEKSSLSKEKCEI